LQKPARSPQPGFLPCPYWPSQAATGIRVFWPSECVEEIANLPSFSEFSVTTRLLALHRHTKRRCQPIKPPAIIKKWLDDDCQTGEEMRDCILRSLEAFREVTIKAASEAGWISIQTRLEPPVGSGCDPMAKSGK
jgi:hypothetical protein